MNIKPAPAPAAKSAVLIKVALSAGQYQLKPGSRQFEIVLLFVRLFQMADAIAGDAGKVANAWKLNGNRVLVGTPAQKICSIAGMTDTIVCLDARRAVT